MLGQVRTLALVFLLLTTQVGLALHALDFDQHSGEGDLECSLCSAAQGMLHALPSSFAAGIARPATEAPPSAVEVERFFPATVFHLARAPPLTPARV
jgi:hypothetical protein